MKRETILAKIKAEPDIHKRIIMRVQYICDYGSQEAKDRTEDILNAAVGYPERKPANLPLSRS